MRASACSRAGLPPPARPSAPPRPTRCSLDYVFQPKVFTELKNAQAVVLAYDGLDPQPPTLCYLKPYYLDVHVSYFEHLRNGAL